MANWLLSGHSLPYCTVFTTEYKINIGFAQKAANPKVVVCASTQESALLKAVSDTD